MIKVITYGTYDLLHEGHINLLKRAKALGDYLIVGITSDGFDKNRGKINGSQTLLERIAAVKETGLADEIVIEEYEGQKIDDVKRYDVDIFAIGSDWVGKFDYLNEYCKVIYLPRTPGISSSDIRSDKRQINIGMIGNLFRLEKYIKESKIVNGVKLKAICTQDTDYDKSNFDNLEYIGNDYYELLKCSDAVFILSHPKMHYEQIKTALEMGKHVLCESPIALSEKQCSELFELAEKKDCVIFDGIKTAYSTAYSRLLLLLKSGIIGKVYSLNATCTSLSSGNIFNENELSDKWNSICAWGTVAMLPVFQIFGTNYKSKTIVSKFVDNDKTFDAMTKVDFIYSDSVATILVGKGIKAEGEMIISGTKGYIYVPAPWWKTDYFEVKYENSYDNKRYFYQLDGEGIRYEIIAFIKAIETGKKSEYITKDISFKISSVIQDFFDKKDLYEIN